MQEHEFIAEHVFLAVIVLYFVFLHLYRWRIGSSRFVARRYWKLRRLKRDVKDQYSIYRDRQLTKRVLFGALKLSVLLVLCYGIYERVSPERKFIHLIDSSAELVREEKFSAAAIELRKALKLRPDYVKGHYALASIYTRLGRPDDAVLELFEVVRLDPGYKDSAEMLSSLLRQRRDAEQLGALASLLAKERPPYSNILRAQSLIMQGRLEPARESLFHAKKIAPDDYKVHRAIGDFYVVAGNPERAIDAYRKTLKLNFGLWRVHYALAKLYLEEGMVAEGIRELNFTRSLKEDFSQASIILAKLHLSTGEEDRALHELEKLLKKNELNDEASYLLAIIYTSKNRYQEAINLFGRLPEKYREKRGYLYNLAFAQHSIGRHREALGQLESLAEPGPLDLPGKRLMARVKFALGSFDEAADIIASLLKDGAAGPKDRELLRLARKELAESRTALLHKRKKELKAVRSRHSDLEAYLADRDFKSLIVGAKKALKENRLKAPFYNLLGAAHLGLGERDLAREYFLLSYNENKTNPVPLINLVNTYMVEGKIGKAEGLLLEHNTRFPGEYATRLILGRIYMETGRAHEAEKLFSGVLELNPRSFEAHRQLAVIRRSKGDIEGALKEYRNAVAINPGDGVSWNDMAYILSMDDETLDHALNYATRAVKLLPGSANVNDTLGWVHYRRGELNKAILSLKNAYEINPHLSIVPYHLGLALYSLKRYDEAEEYLRLSINMMEGKVKEAKDAKRVLGEIMKIRGAKGS